MTKGSWLGCVGRSASLARSTPPLLTVVPCCDYDWTPSAASHPHVPRRTCLPPKHVCNLPKHVWMHPPTHCTHTFSLYVVTGHPVDSQMVTTGRSRVTEAFLLLRLFFPPVHPVWNITICAETLSVALRQMVPN